MPLTYVVGNDGTCVLPTNHTMNVKVWAATVNYVSSDLTGFSHTGKFRRLGVVDITGSLAGTPTYGSGGTPFGTVTANALPSQPGGTLSLYVAGATNATFTSATGAALQFDVVFSSFALNSDKNGDATLTLNYEMADTNGPTVVWATS